MTCQRAADGPAKPAAIQTEPEDEGIDSGDGGTNSAGQEDYDAEVFRNRQFVRDTLRIIIPPLPIPKGWSKANKGKKRAPRETGKRKESKKVSTTQFRKPL